MRRVVLIHGFAGGAGSWEEVVGHLDRSRYRPAAVELPGHGSAAALDPEGYEQAVRITLDAAGAGALLCGYSLGARVALAAALTAPRRVAGLLIISGHAGIEDPARRERRRSADAALSQLIAAQDPADFAASWNAQPVFASDSPAVHSRAAQELLAAHPDRLAPVLRHLGPACFEPCWQRLAELQMPVCAVAGEDDGEYAEHARRIARLCGGREATLNGGHRQHLENPQAVARELEALDAEPG